MLHLLVFPIVVSFFMWQNGFSFPAEWFFICFSQYLSDSNSPGGKSYVHFWCWVSWILSYSNPIFESHINSGTGLPSEFLPGSFLPLLTSPELTFLTTSLPLQAEFSCLCFPISQFKWGRTLEEHSLQQGLSSLLHARQGHFSCPWAGHWDSSPQHRGLQPGQASQRTISAANCAARSSS